jgi:L-ascorbate metabolism protein UlaG (beta-lactamase superfamily)
MTTNIKVTPKPSRGPTNAPSKDHHVGNPPTSFHNPWPSAGEKAGLGALLSARFGSERNFVPVPQGPNGTRSEELVKVVKPDFGAEKKDKLRATWLGHASVLVEFPAATGAERGIRVLFDPVFSERTSPSTWFGPKRYSPTPCTLDELPQVDVVCISHNHYDHLDHATITQLKARGQVHFFAALGNKAWFTQHILCKDDEVTELDWWGSCEVAVDGIGSITLTCTPAQHTSGRTPFDAGQTLWSSWVAENDTKKFYFAGDTAYQAVDTPAPCPAFKDIGELLGPFDMSFLPIGLYSPAHLLGKVHATPEQSLRIHQDIRSRTSIGMHYGTFRGGISGQYEDVREPPRRWREVAIKHDIWRGGGVEGNGDPADTSIEGVGLCHLGETVAV